MFEYEKGFSEFAGKVVIVTGGSKGIGEACVEAFSRVGANVVFCARNEADGKETEKKYSSVGEGKCVFVPCDVANEQDVKKVVKTAVDMFGRIDCLVNNAGYHPPYEAMDDVTGTMFEDLLRTNLVSMFNFSREALPYIRKEKGSIINNASLVGEMGQKKACRYVASKGGIIALTKAMAVDEAEYGVRVNCIEPGMITTPLGEEVARANPEGLKDLEVGASCHHLHRIGMANETASVCVFLASEMASYMTGVCVPISGGSELAYGIKFY